MGWRRVGPLLLAATLAACRSASKAKTEWSPAQKQLGARALTVLRNAMDATESDLRVAACVAFGRVGNPAAVQTLLKGLNDLSDEVRIASAWSLWRLGDATGVPVLQAIIDDVPPPGGENPVLEIKVQVKNRSRALALQTFAEMLGLAAAPVLEDALTDSDRHVRQAASVALIRLGRPQPEALAAIVTASLDENPLTRFETVKTLARVTDPAAVDALKRLARDKERDVRVEALEALGAQGTVVALPEVLEGVGDLDDRIKERAARALSRLRSRSAAPTLRALLQQPLPYKLYGWIGLTRLEFDPRPFVPMEAARSTEAAIRLDSVEALELAGADAVEPLAELVEDADAKVKVRAAAASLIVLSRLKR